MKNRAELLASTAIHNAVDKHRTYNDGGSLPGCALEIVVRYGGRSKRGYFRYPGRKFGYKQRTVRMPLGDYDDRNSGLAELRRKRVTCENLVRENKDPKAHFKRADDQRLEQQKLLERTFGMALEEYFEDARKVRWKSPHTRTVNAGIKTNHNGPKMTDFAALPATGYQLIRIDEDDSVPVESRLSEPETVLGFIVTKYDDERHFNVQPVTPLKVYDDESRRYALICPDGKIYLDPGRDDLVFHSIDDLKQHLRRDAAEVYRQAAADARENDNRKDAVLFSRLAKKFQREVDENE